MPFKNRADRLKYINACNKQREPTIVRAHEIVSQINAALSHLSVTTGVVGGEKCNHEERQVLASGEPIYCVKPLGHEGHHGYRFADPPRASPPKTSEGA